MSEEKRSLWDLLKEKVDFSQSRFTKEAGIEEAALVSRKEGKYFILKNPAYPKYIRLSEKDHFVWERLDGEKSVSELVLAYFMEFKTLAFERIAGLMEQLYTDCFLTAKPVFVFSRIRDYFRKRTFQYRAEQLKEMFFQKTFPINNIDGFLTRLYRGFVWIFFTPAAKILYVIISLIGPVLFFALVFPSDRYQVLKSGDSYAAGFFTFFIIMVVVILIHESAHAFTVKSYGRAVPKGGFLFYFGAPCFYAETTDIWMESKGKRIAVSWAGPYSELILASALSIILALWPAVPGSDIFFKAAIFCYLGVLLNLNPLLEFDGYFILMDWLEIPLLRKKSMTFCKDELWKKLVRRVKLDAEQRIFAVFGFLSIVWSAVEIGIAVLFLKMRFFQIIEELIKGKSVAVKIFSGLFLVLVVIPLLLSFLSIVYLALRNLWKYVVRKGLLTRPFPAAVLTLASGGVAALLPAAFPACGTADYTFGWYLTLTVVMTFAVLRAWRLYDNPVLKVPFLLLLFFVIGRGTGVQMSDIGPSVVREVTVVSFLAACVVSHYNAYAAGHALRIKLLYVSALAAAAWLSVCGLSAGDRVLSVFVGIAAAGCALSLMLNFAGSVLSLSYLLLMCAAVAFGIGNVLGPDNLWWRFAELFTVAAVYVHILGLNRLSARRIAYDPRPGSDCARLVRSFSVLVSGLFDQLQNLRGDYCAGLVGKRLEPLCKQKGVRLAHHRGTVQVRIAQAAGIVPVSDTCKDIAEVLILQSGAACGERWTRRAFYGILESMYWEDKEIMNEYLIRRLTDARGVPFERRRAGESPVPLFRRLEIFKDVPEQELSVLVARFRAERYPDRSTIIRQGAIGDKFYIIESGEVEVVKEDPVLGEQPQATLKSGDYFGEIALLRDVPRTATVRSVTPVKLLSLSKDDFERFIRRYFKFHAHLNAEVKIRDERVTLIKKMPIFAEFSHHQVAMLAMRMQEIVCPAGAPVVKQGDIGDRFYIVKEGEVEVSVVQPDGTVKKISTLRGGEYFGEIALILAVPRTASVTAVRETILLALDKKDFDEMIKKHLLANRNLEEVATRRMYNIRKTNV